MLQKSRKVLLMRHAKSSWDYSGLKDFDRPLNKRGKRDALRMGQYLKELGLVPDQIFSSPAERAKSTAIRVAKELGLSDQNLEWNENLYFKGMQSYLDSIRSADERSEIVMTIGHNPMTETAISVLSENTSQKPIKTATIAYFEFDAESWEDIQAGADRLQWITGPKELK